MTHTTIKTTFELLGRLFNQFGLSEWRVFDSPNASSEYLAQCLRDLVSDTNKEENLSINWNTEDENGKTLAFHILDEYPRAIMVDALILLGVDVHHTDKAGNTLLHEICGCQKIIRMSGGFSYSGEQTAQCIKVLSQLIDINTPNVKGETPIFMVQYTKAILVETPATRLRSAFDAMIECGANIFARDKSGNYFTDFAKQSYPHPEIVSCLENEITAIQRHKLKTAVQQYAPHLSSKGRKI